jgi:magnesium transporter
MAVPPPAQPPETAAVKPETRPSDSPEAFASPTASSSRVTVRLYREGQEACEHPDVERISDLIAERDDLLWVDILDPGPEELEMLGREFEFHRLAIEDAAQQRQRPKVDEYEGYLYMVFYAPAPPLPHRPVRTEEVDFFVGRNYVVTLHQGRLPALEEAAERWEQTDPELRRGPGALLHTIGDAIIDAYFPIVDDLEEQLDRMELILHRPSGRLDSQKLLQVKRGLYTLRRAIYPLREVFNTLLRRDSKLFAPEVYPYLQDTYDHVLRLLDTIDIERDMATGVLDAQLSVFSNRLNETMKRLTAIAVCVAVMGAVFGAWGMNFSTVPGAGLGLIGFVIVTVGALGLAALVLLGGRWLKWW